MRPGAALARLAPEPDRQRPQLVDELRLDVGGRARDLHVREALERLLEQDVELQPGERGAEAEVPAAGAESLVLVGLAPDVEAIRVLERLLVAVGGDVPHDDLVALVDRAAAEL